ncbi:hypothetical protein HDU92_008570 [Lobulomyces angularis]|nr:hypothetical protein HDU92_008570 [Lobulomyces angularis]
MASLNACLPTIPKLASSKGSQINSRKRNVLVAKKVTEKPIENSMEDLTGVQRPVPIAILTTKNMGPRKSKDGKILTHTLLGDADDYFELENLYLPPDEKFEESEMTQKEKDELEQTKTSEFLLKKKIFEENKLREEKEREVWLNRIHIFQRYMEVRQEKALNNWKRHSVEWNRVEQLIAKKTKQDPSQLMMAKIAEFRLIMEEHEFMEEALKLLESCKVDFWRTGLKIGSDLLGLTLPMPTGGQREVERLRSRENITRPLTSDKKYRLQKKEQISDVLSSLDPFYNNEKGEKFLEVVGEGLLNMENLSEAFVSRLEGKMSTLHESQNNKKKIEKSNTDLIKKDQNQEGVLDEVDLKEIELNLNSSDKKKEELFFENQFLNQSDLIFSFKRLSFECNLDQVSSTVLTIHNVGKIAYHFEWVLIPPPNPLKISSIYDQVQRFFFNHKKGVILPGSAFDFVVIFKSARPGVYTETWKILTSPSRSENFQNTVIFQGFAIEKDLTFEKRLENDKMIDKRTATSFATELINSMLNAVPTQTSGVLAALEGEFYETSNNFKNFSSEEELIFVNRNKELNLSYVPYIYTKFVELSKECIQVLLREENENLNPDFEWNGSVNLLNEMLDQVKNQEEKSSFLMRLNDLIIQSSSKVSKNSSAVLYIIGYDLLSLLANQIADASELIRKKLGITQIRTATQKFSKDLEEAVDENDFSRPGGMYSNNGNGLLNGNTLFFNNNQNLNQNLNDADKKKSSPNTVKPTSAGTWTDSRKDLEKKYKKEFKDEVSLLVNTTVTRISRLFNNV